MAQPLEASPEGRIAILAAATSLELLPAGKLRDQDVVEFFDEKVALVADSVRARLEPVSRDLLVGMVGGPDT
jgi:hypothetical protein